MEQKLFKKLQNENKKVNALSLMKVLPFTPEIIVSSNYVAFRYNKGELTIKVEEEGYVIIANGVISIYDLNQKYEVINKIKLFYNPKTENILLFTGAFNPPTIAHYNMIESAMAAYSFDYVIFAISNQEFLNRKQKRNNDWAYSEEERLDMLVNMTYNIPNVLILGVEKTCTYDALTEVKDKYGSNNVYFALGSDKLQEIGKWRHNKQLLTEFCFYVLQRNDSSEYITKKCNEVFKDTKYIVGTDNEQYKDISATKVREKIKNKEDISGLVTPTVLEVIKEKSN